LEDTAATPAFVVSTSAAISVLNVSREEEMALWAVSSLDALAVTASTASRTLSSLWIDSVMPEMLLVSSSTFSIDRWEYTV